MPEVRAQQGQTYITLIISSGPGSLDYFVVVCTKPCGANEHQQVVKYYPGGTSPVNYTNLIPYTTYAFSVVAVKGSKSSINKTTSRKTGLARKFNYFMFVCIRVINNK